MENKDILEENFKKNGKAWDNRDNKDSENKMLRLFKNKNLKIISCTLAGIAAVGACVYWFVNKNKNEIETPITTISDTTKEDEEEVSYKYVLYKPVDYSKETEVDSLISEINKNVEGEPLTKDFLNLLTKDITKEQFGNMSDEEIASELDSIPEKYYTLISSNISSFINEKFDTMVDEEDKIGAEKTDKLVISCFNFIDKNSYAHKTYQPKIDKLLEKELNDIRSSNISEYSANAQEYYDIVMEVLKDKKLNSDTRARFILLNDLKAVYSLFADILKIDSPKKYEELDKEIENLALNGWIQTASTNMGLITDVDLNAPKYESKVSEKYNADDNKMAEAYKGAVKNGKATSVTSNNVKTSGKIIEEATTGKPVTNTTVHKVPESESKKAETTSKKDNSNVTVGKPSVSVSPTEKITEEDVKPETEPESWTYKDSEGDTWVVAPDDNGDYVFDNDQWNKLNGSAKTLK